MLTHPTSLRRTTRIAALMLAVLLVGATAPTTAAPPAPAAPPTSITWDAQPKIITNPARENFPSVAVDANNNTHIAYVAQPTPTSNWEIRYTNNVGGAFNTTGTVIDSVGTTATAVPPAILAAGPNNVLHLVYVLFGIDNVVYYRQSTNNGQTWTSRVPVSGGNKSAAPNLFVDSAGNAHIVWINDQCGGSIYNVFYRVRLANGTFSNISKPKDECGVFQNRPQIAIANGKPQVAFARDTSGNSEIYYARLEGTQWVNQNISQSPGISSQNPAIASDSGNNLFVAWDENAGSHEIFFKASFDGGLTWSSPNNLTNNVGISTAPYVTWSAVSQRAYVVWQDQNNIVSSPEEIWEREFDPASRVTSDAFQISKTSGASRAPSMALGPGHADVAWHDNTSSVYQLYDLGGQIVDGGGGGGGCTGTLDLDNGASQTRNSTLQGKITPSCRDGGAPDMKQISVDAPISSVTTPAPVAYNANPTIDAPTAGCDHTVYVRLIQNNSVGTPFQDTIKVDSHIDASTLAANPHMLGLPPSYNQIGLNDAYVNGVGGASNGAPNYTRDRLFFLGVNDAGDCTGLTSFSVLGSLSAPISTNGYASAIALPGDSSPVAHTITIIISDTIGNQQPYTSALIYDPADTDPLDTVTNTLGLPVLDMSKNPVVTGPASATSIIVTLNFSNISVTDNLYGKQGENLPDGKQFWGIWVANSPTDVLSNSQTLNWTPIQIPSPDLTFSVQWSLFSGLSNPQDRRAGDYFVYVRFLDGAGNPSAAALKAQITLAPNFSVPTSYVPAIQR